MNGWWLSTKAFLALIEIIMVFFLILINKICSINGFLTLNQTCIPGIHPTWP